MPTSRDDDDLMWERAGRRCAICQRPLRSENDEDNDRLAGVVVNFADRPADPGQPEGAATTQNGILLCQFDAISVRDNPYLFLPNVLRRLKTQMENLAAQRAAAAATNPDAAPVRLLVHVAVFQGSPLPLYFVKIVNDSLTKPIQIEEIWFDTVPLAVIDNPQRLLPALLDPGETFETWKPIAEVGQPADILWKARARLGDGTVLASAPNLGVAPVGLVADGGTPLSAVRVDWHKVDSNDPTTWDVFISHASEDKDDIARPLYEELTAIGLSVWFDEATLRLGDSLRRKIDEGVARSAFGIVIISPAYIAKSWTQYELDGIVTMTVSGQQNILPIWHRITREEVQAHSPSLADKVARKTGDYTVSQIAREIADRVRPDLSSGSAGVGIGAD